MLKYFLKKIYSYFIRRKQCILRRDNIYTSNIPRRRELNRKVANYYYEWGTLSNLRAHNARDLYNAN